MKQKIIIGDVHGCFDTLIELISKLPHKDICFVGDLIDRGPKSMQVMDYIIGKGYDCVKGNHEDMMSWAKGGPGDVNWMRNGGFAARHSYRNEDGKIDEGKIKKHVYWVNNLPVTITYDKIVNDKGDKLMISHSMCSPALTRKKYLSKKQFETLVMWDRSFHNIKPISGVYNVFGHTPHKEPRIKSFYACIDTGCCFKDDYGVLTALEYPSMRVFKQENIDGY